MNFNNDSDYNIDIDGSALRDASNIIPLHYNLRCKDYNCKYIVEKNF